MEKGGAKHRGRIGLLLGGLLLALLVQCFAFSVRAAELDMTSSYTNIVAVVDCSSSMQTSDSTWTVPESLYMLVDMCPSEDIRLSLVVYGTDAEIAFRDMPLSEENHESVKRQIRAAIVEPGYNRGQTDTGAALGLARSILEEQAGQNNMVLLFTDGAVRATRNGRSTEQSRSEIDSFAVFCQNNGVVVNTLGLFSAQADPEEVDRAGEELAILKDKTGGQYQRVEDTGDIPDFVISLLSTTLDVLPIALSAPQQVTVDGQAAWQYSLSISDRYTDDITLVLPDPQAPVNGVLLQTGDSGLTPAESWPGASWVSYTRYNGTAGYNVVRLKHLEEQAWTGDYTLFLLTDAPEAPELTAFFLYDVTVHVELDGDAVGVLQPVGVEVYLTDGSGYRIDDEAFLDSLQVDLEVVNLTNMGAEVTQSAVGAEDRAYFDLLQEKMELYNDSFRFRFTPQRAAEYQMTIRVSGDRFTRRVKTQPLTVYDQLEIESSVLTRTPHKNSPLEVRAYLVQQDNHQKVTDAEFYRLCGASATFTNLDTGTAETVEMEALDNGNGLAVSYTPRDEGRYTVVVQTDSSRESVQRVGEELSFQVEDRPIQLRDARQVSWGLLEAYFRGCHTGQEELVFAGDDFFYDSDGDSYRLQCEALSGNGSALVYDNAVHYQPDRGETLQLRLTALDYSGNSVTMELSVRILSLFEVILLTLGTVLVLLALAALVIYLLRAHHCAKNELCGMMTMEVHINGQLPMLVPELCRKDGVYYDLPLPRYYIPLVNPLHIEDSRQLLKTAPTFWGRLLPREVYLGRLLNLYAENYCASGYGMDAVYRYLHAVAGDMIDGEANKKQVCALRGQQKGACFMLRNVSAQPRPDRACLAQKGGRLRRLDRCRVLVPVTNALNSRLEESAGPCACGLQIQLRYWPGGAPAPKTAPARGRKAAGQHTDAAQ